MPRKSLVARRIAVAAIALLCALAPGCADVDPVGKSTPPPSAEPAAAPADTLTMDEIRGLSMLAAEKQQVLPPEFPSQVPVIRGEIVSSNAEMGVVFYTLRAGGSQEQTAEWYRRMYVIANWTLARERTFDDPSGEQILLLQFEKGDVKSSISISEYGEASTVRGTVTVGTGSSEV